MQYGDEHGWFFVYINVICRMYGKSVPLREIIQVRTLSKKHSFSAIYLSIYRNFTNITPKDYIFAAKYDIIQLNVPIFVKREIERTKGTAVSGLPKKSCKWQRNGEDVCLKIKR